MMALGADRASLSAERKPLDLVCLLGDFHQVPTRGVIAADAGVAFPAAGSPPPVPLGGGLFVHEIGGKCSVLATAKSSRLSGVVCNPLLTGHACPALAATASPETGRIPAAVELQPDIFVAVGERFFSQSIVLAAADAHGLQCGTLAIVRFQGGACSAMFSELNSRPKGS